MRLPDRLPICAAHGDISQTPEPPTASESIPPPEVPGYVVTGLLGRGGLGAVYEARPGDGGKPVAIKVAHPDQPSASGRLRSEEKALRAIGPPAVPEVYASGDLTQGTAYLVMELVRASTLAAELGERRTTAEQFASLAPAIVSVVGMSHQKGFIHLDLKPENVFVMPASPGVSGGVKLFDFGLARAAAAAPASERTQSVLEGTSEYMSPEQCDPLAQVDARSDIYSLGVILYEMCSGAPPFWGNSADVRQSQRSRRPRSLQRGVGFWVAPALEEIILRCLAKDPDRRYQNAAQLSDALLSVVGTPSAAPQSRAGFDPAGQAQVATRARERRAMALVFFESKTPVARIRESLAALGAELAHTSGAQYAIAFGHEAGDNPTRSATIAAQALVERGVCERALVDLASVSIQVRPDGNRRYQSALFQRKDQYPGALDPRGVILSPTAAEILPDLPSVPAVTRPGQLLARTSDGASDVSTTRVSLPTLFGRDQLLRTLIDGVRRATTDGVPTITTVVGEPGYGKSHLAGALVQQLESFAPRIDVLIVRAHEGLRGAADQTAREIFRRLLGIPSTAPAELGQALLTNYLGPDLAAEVWPGLSLAMGWVSVDGAEVRALAAAPGALRSATARAAGEVLRAASRVRPLALIIEDAHFADETALDAVEFATLQEAGCRLWVCAIARPGFGVGRTAWATRAGHSHRIDLPPLAPPDAQNLARRLLSPVENVPAGVLAKLVERTRGIPLLLVELVRGLKRDGLVRKSEKTGVWSLATENIDGLPDLPLVEWLASRETASLPSNLMAHARLASAFGPEFTAHELEETLNNLEAEGNAPETDLDAGVGLARLTDSGLLVRHRGGRVGFRHALLREAVYQTVPAPQREQIHRAAFRYYQRAEAAMADEDRLPRMALHAARSGQRGDAARIYAALAATAERRHAYIDAELLYGNVLENLEGDAGDPLAFVRAAQGRGLMRFRSGRPEEALQDLAAARARIQAVRDPIKEAELLLDESVVLDAINDFARAESLAAEAEALLPPRYPPLLEARIAFARARSLHRQERAEQAAILFERSVAVAETLGSDGYETMVQSLSLLGWQYAIARRYEDAERTFARNIAVCEHAGDAFNLTIVLQNRGILSMLSGRIDRLVEDYRRLLSIAREIGYPLIAMLAQKDLGEVELMAGRLEEAEVESRKAIGVAQSIVGERSRGTMAAELLLARICVYKGDLTTARALSLSIRARQQQLRTEGLSEGDFGPSDELLHEMVDLAANGAGDADWDSLFARASAIQQPQDAVEMIEVRAMSAGRLGRPDEGVRRFHEALALAEKSAGVVAERVRRSLALLTDDLAARAASSIPPPAPAERLDR